MLAVTVKLHSANKTHKPKETSADCVDAFCVSEDRLRIAVADGVTRSLYPGDFANSLVNCFCQSSFASDWESWLATARARWCERAVENVAELKRAKSPVYINNNERFVSRTPGAATFAGVEFVPKNNIAKITVIGDSCIFVFAAGKLVDSFPCKAAADFGDQPQSFRTYAEDANTTVPATFELAAIPDGTKGAWWVFATDAFAKWILEKHSAGENVLERLLAVRSAERFRKFVTEVRKTDTNALIDDVTLVVISVGDPNPPAPAIDATNETKDEDASETDVPEEVASGKSIFANASAATPAKPDTAVTPPPSNNCEIAALINVLSPPHLNPNPSCCSAPQQLKNIWHVYGIWIKFGCTVLASIVVLSVVILMLSRNVVPEEKTTEKREYPARILDENQFVIVFATTTTTNSTTTVCPLLLPQSFTNYIWRLY